MILVIGTPGSGKSSYAEKLITEMAEGKRMAYIATMVPYGEEGKARVERHRSLRAGKNFVTFEEPLSMAKVVDKIIEEDIDIALLECVSNLVGNVNYEFHENYPKEDQLVEKIVEDIIMLDDRLKHLVVVTNYFEACASYDDDTDRYIRINNTVNDKLKLLANQIVEKESGQWRVYENN